MHRDGKDYFRHLHFLATPPGNRDARAAGCAVRRRRADGGTTEYQYDLPWFREGRPGKPFAVQTSDTLLGQNLLGAHHIMEASRLRLRGKEPKAFSVWQE